MYISYSNLVPSESLKMIFAVFLILMSFMCPPLWKKNQKVQVIENVPRETSSDQFLIEFSIFQKLNFLAGKKFSN